MLRIAAWVALVLVPAAALAVVAGLDPDTWLYGSEGKDVGLAVAVFLPATVYAYRYGPMPNRWQVGLVLIVCIGWLRAAWGVAWLASGSELEPSAWLEAEYASVTVTKTKTLFGVPVSREEATGEGERWFDEWQGIFAFFGFGVAMFPYTRRRCARCGARVRATVMGSLPWTRQEGVPLREDAARAIAAWSADPGVALGTAANPGAPSWLLLVGERCLRCQHGTRVGASAFVDGRAIGNVKDVEVPPEALEAARRSA